MTEYQLMELIILAAIAGYLIYRLYLILGQSDENSSALKKPGNVIPLRPVNKIRDHVKVKTNKPINPKLADLMKADPSFDEDHFKQGVEAAFVMIVETFAKGQVKQIQPYVSKKVYDTFTRVLEKRAAKGHVHETHVVALTSLDIIKATVSRGYGKISVQINSDQATTIKDSTGKDLNPDEEQNDHVTDQWVFQRKIGSQDPKWVLESIEEAHTEKANG